MIHQRVGPKEKIKRGQIKLTEAAQLFMTKPDPIGRFAYILDAGENTVLTYSVDPSNGNLTSSGAPVATGTYPASITVEPSGKFVYVANQNSNNLSIFSVEPNTGTLTPVGMVPAGTQPVSLATLATLH